MGVPAEVRELGARQKRADTDLCPVQPLKKDGISYHIPCLSLLSRNCGLSWTNFWFPWKPLGEWKFPWDCAIAEKNRRWHVFNIFTQQKIKEMQERTTVKGKQE